MKKLILLATLSAFGIGSAIGATCTGQDGCTACKNCKYCKYCNAGGKCGKCKH